MKAFLIKTYLTCKICVYLELTHVLWLCYIYQYLNTSFKCPTKYSEIYWEFIQCVPEYLFTLHDQVGWFFLVAMVCKELLRCMQDVNDFVDIYLRQSSPNPLITMRLLTITGLFPWVSCSALPGALNCACQLVSSYHLFIMPHVCAGSLIWKVRYHTSGV